MTIRLYAERRDENGNATYTDELSSYLLRENDSECDSEIHFPKPNEENGDWCSKPNPKYNPNVDFELANGNFFHLMEYLGYSLTKGEAFETVIDNGVDCGNYRLVETFAAFEQRVVEALYNKVQNSNGSMMAVYIARLTAFCAVMRERGATHIIAW